MAIGYDSPEVNKEDIEINRLNVHTSFHLNLFSGIAQEKGFDRALVYQE
jgi:hypothetical protein